MVEVSFSDLFQEEVDIEQVLDTSLVELIEMEMFQISMKQNRFYFWTVQQVKNLLLLVLYQIVFDSLTFKLVEVYQYFGRRLII